MDISKEIQLLKLQNNFLFDEICSLTHEHFSLIVEKESIKYNLSKRIRLLENLLNIDNIEIEKISDDFYSELHTSILEKIEKNANEVLNKLHEDFASLK
ncbi:MAG: hypothetical protein RBT59_11560 [Arcobacteraceae bacterium]|jgi:hypothetical protein|nr:hypothetical protein [Arcobacteraceae bacterium]